MITWGWVGGGGGGGGYDIISESITSSCSVLRMRIMLSRSGDHDLQRLTGPDTDMAEG